jgi:hypothetical protein
MSKDKSEVTAQKWKTKSKLQSRELARHRKRLQEVCRSRDMWKQKYMLARRGLPGDTNLGDCSKARGHSYSLYLVELCFRLYRYGGMSFRCCEHCLRCLYGKLGLGFRYPSHVSIRNWVLKQGRYSWGKMGEAVSCPGQWALIVDESITIGTERLLVVLGLELSQWKFDRAVTLEDVRILHLESRSAWKGDAVGEVLRQCSAGLEVVQGVSDAGRNLLSAFELCSYAHLPDCSHAVAAILERHLSKDAMFHQMNSLLGELRQQWATSQYAKWIPPKQRGKSRFLNVFLVVKWAQKILQKEAELPAVVRQKTQWLFENRGFVEQFIALEKMVGGMLTTLKQNGACAKSLDKAQTFISHNASPPFDHICEGLRHYVDKLKEKTKENKTPWLCCSDIIETLFGMFKYRINPNLGITDLALILPLFCGRLGTQEIKEALENVKCDQIKDWKKTTGILKTERKNDSILNTPGLRFKVGPKHE